MKKKILLILLIILSITLVGCTKEEDKWTIDVSKESGEFDTEIQTIFDEARASSKYKSKELIPIALLGEQVVSGKNYMFLCNYKGKYSVVIVYKDTKGKSKITSINDFDPKSFINKKSSNDKTVGAWETKIPNYQTQLDEKLQKSFAEAIEKNVGVTYLPITVLAHYDNQYELLSYGRISDRNSTTGVYVIILNTTNNKIGPITQVDLADYNK